MRLESGAAAIGVSVTFTGESDASRLTRFHWDWLEDNFTGVN